MRAPVVAVGRGRVGRGDAEVDELVDAARVDDVRRLDVAMHEPGAMHRRERRGDGDADVERLGDPELALAREPGVERRAGDVLHRDAHHLRGVVDGERIEADDVRVLDLAERARLGDDPLTLVGVVPGALALEGEELHRGGAELGRAVRLLGEPDRREAATTELLDEDERPDPTLLGRALEQRLDVGDVPPHLAGVGWLSIAETPVAGEAPHGLRSRTSDPSNRDQPKKISGD